MTENTTYRVNPSFVLVKTSENSLHFRAGPWSGPIFSLTDRDESGKIQHLVELLTGKTDVATFLNSRPSEEYKNILEVLEQLESKNIIQNVNKSPTSTFPKDSLNGYLSLSNRYSNEDIESLTSSHVLVISAGRMGQMVSEDLSDMGVGTVKMISIRGDEKLPDLVERVSLDQLPSELEKSDLTLFLTDRPYPELENRLNERSLETKTPLLPGSIHGFDGFVGPLVIPGSTACYNCFKQRAYANMNQSKHYREYEYSDNSSIIGKMPNFSRIISGLVTTEAITMLTNGVGFTASRVISYDFHDLSVESNDVLIYPRCDKCGNDISQERQRHITMNEVLEEVSLND